MYTYSYSLVYYYTYVHSVTMGYLLQITVSQKFPDAVLGSTVRISSLDLETRYPVLHAERLETKYGTSFFLTISESTNNVIKIFLPRRYIVVFTDEDIKD